MSKKGNIVLFIVSIVGMIVGTIILMTSTIGNMKRGVEFLIIDNDIDIYTIGIIVLIVPVFFCLGYYAGRGLNSKS
jgi:hypothetical protein